MTAMVRGDDNTGEGHAHNDSDEYRKYESPLDGVNRMYEIYRERARSEKRDKSETKTRKNPNGTIPPSLRKKVLLRDGGRCPPAGAGKCRDAADHTLWKCIISFPREHVVHMCLNNFLLYANSVTT